MRTLTRCLGRVLLAWALTATSITAAADAPPLALAGVYHHGDTIDLPAYWVSEKFDGVRAFWDGKTLITRQGNPIHAPTWFVAGWPATPLDGELWAGRGQFETTSGTVRKDVPDDAQWRQIQYLVFDLPDQSGPFDTRLAVLPAAIAAINRPWVKAVHQQRGSTATALQAQMQKVLVSGGEGLMLHRGSAPYRAGRSDDLLKFKPFDDAEAVVVAHSPGKGKYQGMLGSLVVERPDGTRFRIGSGLTDLQRRDPPPVGSWVTYSYTGFTRNGLPRFARLLRIRSDLSRAAP